MSEFIQSIKDWPVIVQGALGSALFWLILVSLQTLFRAAGQQVSKHSRSSRESWLVSQLYKYQAFQYRPGGDARSAFRVSTLIYRSLRHLFMGMMWLCMGFLLQSILPVAGVIGFAGCLFYVLKGYEVVKPYESGIDLAEEEKKILDELIHMGAFTEHASKKQPPADDVPKAAPEE